MTITNIFFNQIRDIDDNGSGGQGQRQILQEAPAVRGPFADWVGFTTPRPTVSSTPAPQPGSIQQGAVAATPTTLSGHFLSQSVM